MYKCTGCHEEPNFNYNVEIISLNCNCGKANRFSIPCPDIKEIFNRQKELETLWNLTIDKIIEEQKICKTCGKKYETIDDALSCSEKDNHKYKYNIGDIICFYDYTMDHVGYVNAEIINKLKLTEDHETYNGDSISCYGENGYKVKFYNHFGNITSAYIVEDDIRNLISTQKDNKINEQTMNKFKNIAEDFFNQSKLKFNYFGNKIEIEIKDK